jgi:hypothetical protein
MQLNAAFLSATFVGMLIGFNAGFQHIIDMAHADRIP